ncbi:esterase [Brachybacterium endophyticum]|uniref:Esterase n=1 Tax=Brachybacterium endophyticum TaxID=2182385 RepID=A0A2U2RNX0_9MICO|nr:alpha/beta hydrolase fold domain-containing protein [Brachybacterium endophyticum]PWH07531.1 esterase [Brachybacterium endophyticum]
MSRIRDAVMMAGRTVRRLPLPKAFYTHTLREARRPMPGGGVLKRHAVDVEMVDRTRCVWLDRHHASEGVIVHLHGGAFVSGPFAGDWAWLSHQVDARRCAGVLVDYRTAPDHQHPVALEDVEAVLVELSRSGVLGDAPWVLSAHNAGAGLALALVRRIRDGHGPLKDVPAPSLVVMMSPWADLELANTGMTETGRKDFPQERRMLGVAAQAYAGRTPLDDPDLSPVNAHLHELPPMHLSVGTSDIFLTDARVLRLQLEEAGPEVAYREVHGRLALLSGLRGGEEMGRLLGEQRAAIATALSPRR